MLSVGIYEIFIKGIPESFLVVLLFYILSNVKLQKGKYLIITISYFVFTLVTRQFDFSAEESTNNMLHTLGSFSIVAILMNILCKVNALRVILSLLISIITLMLSEMLAFVYLGLTLGSEKTKLIVSHMFSRKHPVENAIAGIPSTVLFIIAIVLIRYLMKYFEERKKKKATKVAKES